MSESDFEVRPAREEDLVGMLELVHELVRCLFGCGVVLGCSLKSKSILAKAVFEKEPEAVVATLDDYKTNFADGTFRALVAANKQDGKVLGMVLYYPMFSTWKGKSLYLEDFVVREGERGRGGGRALFAALRGVAAEWNAALIKFQVFVLFLFLFQSSSSSSSSFCFSLLFYFLKKKIRLNNLFLLACCFVQVLDWNESAVKFYEKQGAVLEKDWWNVKVFPPYIEKDAKGE